MITADRANTFPEYELEGRDDKDWLVAVVDVTNWSGDDETLNPRDFALELPGGDDPRGFARRTTERVAEQLDMEPTNTDDGVAIDEGESERLVLVFELPIDSIDPKLFLDGESLSIQGAIDGGPAMDALPEMADPPTADEVELGEVINGFTLTVGDDETETVLSFVDGPLPDECFGEEATRRLTRLATDTAVRGRARRRHAGLVGRGRFQPPAAQLRADRRRLCRGLPRMSADRSRSG